MIRHNVFAKQDAVPGPLARPKVLLGHFPLTGAGSDDRYLVYGNLFLHNPSEALLQAEGRVAIYDNVFINGSGDAVRIRPHNDVPRDMDIFFNTVLAAGSGIQVRQAEGAAYRQRVIGNVVAAAAPLLGGEAANNVTLDFRPEFLAVAPADLTSLLLDSSSAWSPVPQARVHELEAYPAWQRAAHPGARIAPALLRAMDGTPP